MKKLLQKTMPLFFAFGLILSTVLLLMPSYAVPKAFDFYDKAQHGLMFTALVVAGLMAYPKHWKIIVLGLICYGGLMEILQSALTTTRYGEWLDWLADCAGIAVGSGAYLLSPKFTKITTNKIAA